MNLNSYLSSFTKINLKWITDLNAKAKIIKLLKDSKREYHHHLEVHKDILGGTQKALTIETNDKLDFIKMKNNCSSKNTIQKSTDIMKTEKILYVDIRISDKGSNLEYIKNSYNLIKRQTTQSKK